MVLAAIDAVNAGRSASNFISPMTNTSIAKKTAAMGVPNNPEKPAAIPATRKIGPAFFMGKCLPIQ